MDISDIFGQGLDAYGANIPRDDCPYPAESDEWEICLDGMGRSEEHF
jgi:hypothetical protein